MPAILPLVSRRRIAARCYPTSSHRVNSSQKTSSATPSKLPTTIAFFLTKLSAQFDGLPPAEYRNPNAALRWPAFLVRDTIAFVKRKTASSNDLEQVIVRKRVLIRRHWSRTGIPCRDVGLFGRVVF